jgi:SAM-dependent methyltransferase
MSKLAKIDDSTRTECDVSSHYLGGSGELYFASQRQTGNLAAKWNLPIWQPHVGHEHSVLDFGCGGGYLLALLPARRRVGVEVNPAARQQAEMLGMEVYRSIDEVPSEKFTRIISSHALEHVLAPLATLQGLSQLLQPTGRLLLLLPLDDWRAGTHRSFHQGCFDHHLYSWTPQNLGNLLVEAGYRPVKVEIIVDAMPPGARLIGIAQKSQAARNILGRLTGTMLRRRQLFAVAELGTL